MAPTPKALFVVLTLASGAFAEELDAGVTSSQPALTGVPLSALPLPSAIAGPTGFGMKSPDGAFRLLFHWALLSDFQALLGPLPPGVTTRDSFVVRFAGMQIDATIHERLHSQVFVDFSQSKVTLYDAWVEALLLPELKLRAGKFLFPISEERLTPGIALPFVSTSFAALLLPSRDTGVQVYGTFGHGLLTYNLAFTNGAFSGTLSDVDLDSEKDVVGRVFARPFEQTSWSAIRHLGVGVGASWGVHSGSTDAPGLPVLRTYGGQSFFAFANDKTSSGTATASGQVLRVVPHATWSWGPVAAYADWAHIEERVGGSVVTTDGYSIVPSVVLTGEDAAPLSYIVPKHPFDPLHGSFGTVLLVLGAGRIHVSDAAFLSGAALPAAAMQSSMVVGGGLNWYPVSGFSVLASYGHMWFDAFGGAPPRPPENALTVRLQMVL
jgi:phosphate-selective porin OprO and OprP